MERSVEVRTGESVAFRFELAGLGSRFFAMFIDLSIQIAVLIGAIFLFAWLGSALPSTKAPVGNAAIEKFAAATLEGLAIFAIFMLFFGYFILFEWLSGGRTPGKRILGIRVVRDGGFPLDFTSAVIRNVVRMLEFALAFYAVSAVVTLLSPLNRRLGDMAAGTLVVRDQRYERAHALPESRRERDDPVVRDLSPAEREAVRRYADRRPSLTPRARVQVAAQLALTIRPRLAATYDHLDDDALLVFLAENALA